MKYINDIKNKLKYFYPYFFTIILIVLPWFLNSGYLFFTDEIWGPNIVIDWSSPWYFASLLIKGLSLFLSIAFIEKLFILSVLLLIILGGGFLVKSIFEYYFSETEFKINKTLVYILSLFSLFNPFVYDRALYGQFRFLLAYGLLFFILGFLLKACRTLDFSNLLKASIFTALTILFSAHFIFFLIPFYLILFVFLYLKRRELMKNKLLNKFWIYSFFSLLIILIINANWLLALSLNKSTTANFVNQIISNQDLVAFQTAGENELETFTNVLLMSGFWGKEQFRYLDLTDISGWQKGFIFLLPIILYGVYLSFHKRSKHEKIFSSSLIIVFVLAVFLAIGIKSSITHDFSSYLYDYLPFYKGLRESQKWVVVIIPIYLFYLTLGAYKLSKQKFVVDNEFVCGVILALIIIMQTPSLLWGFNRQVKPIPYPSDWYEVNNLIVDKSARSYGCNDRILFLPWHLYMSFGWIGKIVANPAPVFFACPVLSGENMEFGGIYDNSFRPEENIINNWVKEKGNSGSPQLTSSPIRYIILAKEVDYAKYSWLKDLPYLKTLGETKTLFIYEIK